jgi:hypothetical protein
MSLERNEGTPEEAARGEITPQSDQTIGMGLMHEQIVGNAPYN